YRRKKKHEGGRNPPPSQRGDRMKTQLTSLGVLVAGAVLLGTLEACAPTQPMMEPTVAETAPTRSAEAPARELATPPADASKSAPEAPSVQSAGEAVPPSLIAAGTNNDKLLPPARSLTDLTVQRTKHSVVVLITGDGDLTYDVTKLSGNRLVIDLMNVVNGTKRQAVPVGHQFMRQIRIGVHQFPQAKVRLVLDLGRTVPFIIEKTGERISLGLQDAEISSVLRLIADVSGLNMVVGEAVKSKVTLKLLNVPWDQALDLILKLNNLGQIREGNILWIDTLANITRLRDDAAKAKESTLKAEELVTRIIYLNYSDAAKSIDVAKSSLSPRGEIKVDSRTNALVVRDIQDNVARVERIIHDLDQRTPQVQIEARIVQASKNFARGLGIQWGLSSIRTTSTGSGKDAPITLNVGASGVAVGTQANDFLVNLPAAASGVSVPGSTI